MRSQLPKLVNALLKSLRSFIDAWDDGRGNDDVGEYAALLVSSHMTAMRQTWAYRRANGVYEKTYLDVGRGIEG